jgi:hypothetical protein
VDQIPESVGTLFFSCVIKDDILSIYEDNTLASFCFKCNHFKGEFSWAKIPVGECGEGNINKEKRIKFC